MSRPVWFSSSHCSQPCDIKPLLYYGLNYELLRSLCPARDNMLFHRFLVKASHKSSGQISPIIIKMLLCSIHVPLYLPKAVSQTKNTFAFRRFNCGLLLATNARGLHICWVQSIRLQKRMIKSKSSNLPVCLEGKVLLINLIMQPSLLFSQWVLTRARLACPCTCSTAAHIWRLSRPSPAGCQHSWLGHFLALQESGFQKETCLTKKHFQKTCCQTVHLLGHFPKAGLLWFLWASVLNSLGVVGLNH